MIEKSRENLRIRCDTEGCERVFSPRPPVPNPFAGAHPFAAAAAELRNRGAGHGWRVRIGRAFGQRELQLGQVDAPKADLCPRHAR